MATRGARLHRVARTEGVHAALAVLHEGRHRAGPGGHVLVSGPGAPGLLGELGLVLDRGDGPAPSATELGWLRLGLSERLLAATLAHLGGRDLLRHQLVKGQLADVALRHLTARAFLAEDSAPDAHEELTRADRELAALLGAHGFTSSGPGHLAHVSELLAELYLEAA